MRAVLDTNTVISGLLWHGPPRQVLDLAREGKLTFQQIAIVSASNFLAKYTQEEPNE